MRGVLAIALWGAGGFALAMGVIVHRRAVRWSCVVLALCVASAGLTWLVALRSGAIPSTDIPHFSIVPFAWALIPPVLALCAYRALRRRCPDPYRSCCRHCGYDLRGLSERRCPECGTPFSAEDARDASNPRDGTQD